MDDAKILELFKPLFADLQGDESFPAKRPLLAHYTSVAVLEAILQNNEVWLSNPLFMNDVEEVRFGMANGANVFLGSPEVESACGSKERFASLKSTFLDGYNTFANDHLLDLYVFCLSEHRREDNDGLLSMWRGYGGNGNGLAIVFDTAKITAREDSPLIIRIVNYGTAQERINWLQERVAQFAGILASSSIPDDKLGICSYYFFERLKLFSIFTKHQGFREENEWRLAYLEDRDEARVFSKDVQLLARAARCRAETEIKDRGYSRFARDRCDPLRLSRADHSRAVSVVPAGSRYNPEDAGLTWETRFKGSH